MGIRQNTPTTSVDAALQGLGGPRTRELLDAIDAVVSWDQVVAPVLRLPGYASGRRGHPAWNPVAMVKCLMLAQWFGLSDPALEEALRDRLAFRRFVGLSIQDKTPDETTFVNFRKRLRGAGLFDTVLASVEEDLRRARLLVKRGATADAVLVRRSGGWAPGENRATNERALTTSPRICSEVSGA